MRRTQSWPTASVRERWAAAEATRAVGTGAEARRVDAGMTAAVAALSAGDSTAGAWEAMAMRVGMPAGVAVAAAT
eukprot:7389953-Prymnesium_polylepis.1